MKNELNDLFNFLLFGWNWFPFVFGGFTEAIVSNVVHVTGANAKEMTSQELGMDALWFR